MGDVDFDVESDFFKKNNYVLNADDTTVCVIVIRLTMHVSRFEIVIVLTL